MFLEKTGKNGEKKIGPVCDNGWNNKNARVVCRQLGYNSGKAVIGSLYGLTPTAFVMDQVRCDGSETKIQDCQQNKQNKEECTSGDAAGVECFNKLGGGTISKETEQLLYTKKCQKEINELPKVIRQTIMNIIETTCNSDVYTAQDCFPRTDCTQSLSSSSQSGSRIVPRRTKTKDKLKQNKKNKNKNKKTKKEHNNRIGKGFRITPIEAIEEFGDVEQVISPGLDFTNTRNRYSWICSLRTRGTSPDHLCAVTILSVPPQPTVIGNVQIDSHHLDYNGIVW